MRRYFFYIVFLLFAMIRFNLYALETKVILVSGGNDVYRNQVEKNLTAVLNGINQSRSTHTSLQNLSQYFDPSGFQEFLELQKATQFYATQKEYRTHLLRTEDGFFEIRNIKVRIYLGKTEGLPFQNLVFTIDPAGQITNVCFAVEDYHYQTIIEQGRQLEDLAFREKILHFIEMYRTAYNRKDIEFIERTLSEDALIIVGSVVKVQKQDRDYLKSSYLSEEKIEFIRLGKYEYLERLKKVFKNNDFVRVQFDEINIQRHPQISQIYGVQLKQIWNSSIYSDNGYLFLLVDFKDENEPIIHVRAWQPDKFTDGSTINLYDFEVVE